MSLKTYSKGTLLWVDDDFAKNDFRGETSDADVWRRTFGNTESRVYRLLGLHLAIATSYEEACEALSDLSGPDNRDTYTIAVVDLRIPKTRAINGSTSIPDVKYGCMFAKKLLEKGIPFFFLSSQSSVADILHGFGLESVPYYRKCIEAGRSMMPEELARAVLNDFRNKISWIDIDSFFSSFSSDSVFPSNIFGFDASRRRDADHRVMARSYFPFFGSFRDFVERWEHRPFQGRSQTVVLRCPEFHSDEFIVQCLVIIFSPILRRDKLTMRYVDVRTQSDLRIAIASRGVDKDLSVYRIHPAKISAADVGAVIRNARESNMVFVLPNDDSADPFLEVLPRHKDIQYDDLPGIRFGDHHAREELIRRACEFVFQQWRVVLDGEEQTLHPFYLDNPSVAINPVNWVALLEKNEISEDLSDPYEILEVFLESTMNLGSPAFRDKLASGRPLDFDELLRVAEPRIVDCCNLIATWRRRALEIWLGTSWHSPYGVTDAAALSDSLKEKDAYAWEDHCLNVAVRLSELVSESEGCLAGPKDGDLDRAVKFLKHKTVGELLHGNLSSGDNGGLEFLRWPHSRFPMPAALSRRLREARRYLSVQSDYLDLAPLLPAGNMAWDVLRSVVDEYAARLEWMKNVSDSLPEGWRQSVAYLAGIIDSRDIERAWTSDRWAVWDALLGFLRNATPVSVVYHYLICSRLTTEKERNNLEIILSQVKGYGLLLGHIRGHRRFVRTNALRLRSISGKVWGSSSETVAAQLDFVSRLSAGLGVLGEGRVLDIQSKLARFLKAIHDADAQTGIDDDGLFCGTLDRNHQFLEVLSSAELGMDADWFISKKPDVSADSMIFRPEEAYPSSAFPSLFASPEDYLWQGLDLLHNLRIATYMIRYFDGYPAIAALNDLRYGGKDTPPQVMTPVIEEVLQLLVWGLEGLVAQLKFCLDACNSPYAEKIKLDTIDSMKPLTYQPLAPVDLERFFRVSAMPSDEYPSSRYGVFVKGIPGSGICNDYTLHREGAIIHLHEVSPRSKRA